MLKWLYNKLHPAVETTPVHSIDPSEAKRANQRAELDLERVRENAPKVAEIATKLKDQRERNHFGEMLEASMKRK